MDPEEKLRQLGITLAPPAPNNAPLIPSVRTGNLLYLSGSGPNRQGQPGWQGKLGKEYTTDQGYQAARECGINLLAAAKGALGDLKRVRRVVKLLGMVACTPEFTEQPRVINGCSELFVELWGEQGRHARSAVGMAALPGGIPVEIEAILEVD